MWRDSACGSKCTDGLLESGGWSDWTSTSAVALVELRADPELQGRMDELAEKCNEGKLSSEEREEYETSVRFANYLAIIQAKASRLLRASKRK